MKNEGIVLCCGGVHAPRTCDCKSFWRNFCSPMYDYRDEKIYVFDLDGTLADINHRLHHIVKPSGEVKDWDSFFKACVDDKPIKPMIDLLNQLSIHDGRDYCNIWIVTGRSSKVIKETMVWLNDCHVRYDRLFMRKEGDHRPDHEIKEEWLLSVPEYIRQNRIVCVFEDRKSVVDMWRRNEVFCCQVNGASDGKLGKDY